MSLFHIHSTIITPKKNQHSSDNIISHAVYIQISPVVLYSFGGCLIQNPAENHIAFGFHAPLVSLNVKLSLCYCFVLVTLAFRKSSGNPLLLCREETIPAKAGSRDAGEEALAVLSDSTVQWNFLQRRVSSFSALSGTVATRHCGGLGV